MAVINPLIRLNRPDRLSQTRLSPIRFDPIRLSLIRLNPIPVSPDRLNLIRLNLIPAQPNPGQPRPGQPNPGQPVPGFTPVYDPFDHTAEFDPKDISDNKVMSMLVYLMGWIGIIIALLGSSSSPYVAFHVRQALKLIAVNILMSICAVLLCWTLIVPLAYAIMSVVFFVIKIICFFQVCSGKAKEPAIIRNLNFLK